MWHVRDRAIEIVLKGLTVKGVNPINVRVGSWLVHKSNRPSLPTWAGRRPLSQSGWVDVSGLTPLIPRDSFSSKTIGVPPLVIPTVVFVHRCVPRCVSLQGSAS